jgi:copper homeostasis protein
MPLEIACFSAESALLAAKAGADRIELCMGASVGGMTPALEDLQVVKASVSIPVNVMIRPRGGDFTYTDGEIEQMKTDIERFHSVADGFVFGILDSNRRIDRIRNRELVELAAPKPCTFHRAFDETPDLVQAVEDIAQCGFASILTSGGKPNAILGADSIAEVLQRANEKFSVIVGGGVRASNIEKLKATTLASWFHSSAIVDGTEVASKDEVANLQEVLKC